MKTMERPTDQRPRPPADEPSFLDSPPGRSTRARPPKPRRRRRRRWPRVLLLALGLVVLVGAVSVAVALGVRSHLERARSDLTVAQDALLGGNVAKARTAFDLASREFRAAGSQHGGFLLRAEQHLPLVDRTPRVLIGLTVIGVEVSDAGAGVAAQLAALPGGLAALGPKDGRLPIEALQRLGPVVHQAAQIIAAAKAKADALPASWVPGPVSAASDAVRSKLDHAAPLALAADALLRELPAFAGQDGVRRYFIAPQNVSESRGTGGLIGNFSILTIDHGRMSFSPTSDISALPDASSPAGLDPSAEFSRIYDTFGGAGFWLNINMTPDAPTASAAVEALYQRDTGSRLDGVILVDLDALSNMLTATGPIPVPRLHTTLTAGNVVGFVAKAAYLNLPGNAFTLGPRLVAEAVLHRFFTAAPPLKALRALVGAAANGHIMVDPADPRQQAAFRLAGVTGDYRAPATGDFFGAVTSNAAGNKVDYDVDRSIRDEVYLQSNGAAREDTELELVNHVPAGSAGSYVLGPYPGSKLGPGVDQLWTAFYCTTYCHLDQALQDGEPLPMGRYQEHGLSLYANFVRIDPQQTRTLALTLDSPNVWQGDRTGGEYHLHVPGQATGHRVAATVVVHAPDGMRVAWTSVPMRVSGDTATWHGLLGVGQDFAVRFHRPFVPRVLERVWQFLSKPIRF